MTTTILDGRRTAASIRSEIAQRVRDWTSMGGPIPSLTAILVGDDPASLVYVRNKQKACREAGMESQVIRKPADTTTSDLVDLLEELNSEESVHAILVQLPLPGGIDTQRVLDAVSPLKDVDAFSPENMGLLVQERPRFLPCTPHGVLQLLVRHRLMVRGKQVVVVGRSEIVGKPMAIMLMQKNSGFGPEFANATVTVAHSQSRHLGNITRSADILIAAAGRAKLIGADMVRPGAIVIDVGINRLGDSLVGDVDFEAVQSIAGAITPVPGGVGPLTIAMLLHNTLQACQIQNPQWKLPPQCIV